MSKGVKFRAWDKENKKMFEVSSINFDEKEAGYICEMQIPEHNIEADECFLDFNEIELMQYTGLKDCKGREIYKGDIIEFALSLIETIKGSIEFDYGVFYLKPADKKYGNVLLANMNFDLVEVIGNIYENKDLLDG